MILPSTFPPLKVHGKIIDFSEPVIMGIVNVTPDSFFDGGENIDPFVAIEAGRRMATEGAVILDIGGESTRPGSAPVSIEDEIKRILPVIQVLSDEEFIVSVDTMKSEVAVAALEVGASIVNDVSGGRDPQMFDVISDFGAAVVIGHMRGMPKNMQDSISFNEIVEDVTRELSISVELALKAGIPKTQIIIDPGIGFGKTAEQCSILMGASGHISKTLGYPILVGPSNKSFIGKLTGAPVDRRNGGTLSSSLLSYLGGANIFRVHNVYELNQAFDIAKSVLPSLRLCQD